MKSQARLVSCDVQRGRGAIEDTGGGFRVVDGGPLVVDH